MKDITWINAEGTEMTEQGWAEDHARMLGLLLNGDPTGIEDEHGRPVRDDTLLMFFNAAVENVEITLPTVGDGRWRHVIDTAHESGFLRFRPRMAPGAKVRLRGQSFCLFELDRSGSGASVEAAESGENAAAPPPIENTV